MLEAQIHRLEKKARFEEIWRNLNWTCRNLTDCQIRNLWFGKDCGNEKPTKQLIWLICATSDLWHFVRSLHSLNCFRMFCYSSHSSCSMLFHIVPIAPGGCKQDCSCPSTLWATEEGRQTNRESSKRHEINEVLILVWRDITRCYFELWHVLKSWYIRSYIMVLVLYGAIRSCKEQTRSAEEF